jgi:hypothetical protein
MRSSLAAAGDSAAGKHVAGKSELLQQSTSKGRQRHIMYIALHLPAVSRG